MSKAALILLISLLPLALWAVFHVPIGTAELHQWLPENRIERQRYQEFLNRFGSDQVLLVSWEGAIVDDPRVAQFVQLAVAEASVGDLVTSVVSPVEILNSLQQAPLKLSPAEAVDRLTGTLIGKNGTVSIVINTSPLGARKHKQTIELVQRLADMVPGLGREKLKLVGTVFESHAIDKAAEDSFSKLVLPSTVLALLLSWFCVGSVQAVCVVMLLAGFAQLVAVSVVYYGGFEFSAVMIVLPTLVFMLTLTGAIHLINYLLDAKQRSADAGGIDAVWVGWQPCLLSSATTMLGMLSLLTSELLPVRQFGYLSAICLGVATFMLLMTFPAAANLLFGLQNWLSLLRHSKAATVEPSAAGTLLRIPAAIRIHVQSSLEHFANWISIGGLVLLLMALVGVTKLKSSTKFYEMFPPSSRSYQNLAWFESNVGPIATVEVLLRYPRDEDSNLLDQAYQVIRLNSELRKSEKLGRSYSAANFFPKVAESKGIRATAIRAAQKRSLEANVDLLRDQKLIYQSDTETIWRLSVRVSALSAMGYGQLTEVVAGEVRRGLPHTSLKPSVELTGLYPVLHDTQTMLLSDLGFSFLSAYLLITPIMMVVVRSILGGLLIMIPNVLPIAISFGIMGWCGWTLDIAGVLTASIALGISVDDTLHFVCWYIKERKRDCTASEAVSRAFHACSSAMIHTTLICGCSMMPFLFADFLPTRQFATLMISILLVALVADLVLLPALLLSSAGKTFLRYKGE